MLDNEPGVCSNTFRNKHLMRLRLCLLWVIVVVCLAGCGKRQTAIPADSFQLSLTDLLASDDERFSNIKIETLDDQRYALRVEHALFFSGDTSPINGRGASAAVPDRQQGITLVAYRHAGEKGKRDWGKAIIKNEQIHHTDPRSLPPGTSLTNVLALNIRDGIYPLNKPINIGRLHGQDLLLIVGQSGVETAKR